MKNLLQRIRRALCFHECFIYRHDHTPNLQSRTDGKVEARCWKCGAILVGDYGLQIQGFRFGTEPRPPR